jgi:hypothetical protein
MIPDGLDRKPVQPSEQPPEVRRQSDLDAIAERVRLAEHVKGVIQASTAARGGGQRQTSTSSEPPTFQAHLNVELERITLSASDSHTLERKTVSLSMDTSSRRCAASGGPLQHSDVVNVDLLARKWQSVVGAKSAATSRPVGIVENQLIIEMTPKTILSGADMARAIAALDRANVDRVAIRVVNTLHDRQSQTQTQHQGIRR